MTGGVSFAIDDGAGRGTAGPIPGPEPAAGIPAAGIIGEGALRGTWGTTTAPSAPGAMGNENALIDGWAGAGPRIDSRSAGFRVTPPAFSMALSIPWFRLCAARR